MIILYSVKFFVAWFILFLQNQTSNDLRADVLFKSFIHLRTTGQPFCSLTPSLSLAIARKSLKISRNRKRTPTNIILFAFGGYVCLVGVFCVCVDSRFLSKVTGSGCDVDVDPDPDPGWCWPWRLWWCWFWHYES